MVSNLNIGTRIGALVVAALLTIGLLGGVVAMGAQRVFTATAALEQYRQLYERTAGVERRASRLRFQALRFVSERDTGAAGQFDRNRAEIAGLLTEIADTAGALVQTADLEAVTAGLASLKERFDAVVKGAVVLGLTDDAGLRGALRASARAIEDELKQWPNADKLISRMESMRKMEKDFIIYNDESLLSGHRKAFNEFSFFLSDAGLDMATQTKLEKMARGYRSELGKFVDATKAFRADVQAFTEEFQALGPRFEALLEQGTAGMVTAVETQNSVRDEVVHSILVAGAILLPLFLAISLFVARSITGPLRRIEGVMERLASGDRAAVVPGTDQRDEIGAMARAVQVFKDNLQKTHELEIEAREAERRAEEERKTALRAVAQDFDHAFGRVLNTVGSAAEQIRAGAYILRDTADKIREQAMDTAHKAEQTAEVVGIVNTVSQTLTGSIGDIGVRVNDAGSAVQRAVAHARGSDAAVLALTESSQRIGEIVDLINRIAAQTNLLALNATIEAARAGEAGKGFAVVASEVKTLANQTAAATQEISGQVVAIQTATGDVVGAIRSIRSTIEEVDGLSREVSTAVGRQLEQTREIVNAVSRASDNSQEVSDSVSTMAITSAETGKAALEMIYSAAQLSEEFKQLEADADRFVQSISV